MKKTDAFPSGRIADDLAQLDRPALDRFSIDHRPRCGRLYPELGVTPVLWQRAIIIGKPATIPCRRHIILLLLR
jgi:hypothetical protein